MLLLLAMLYLSKFMNSQSSATISLTKTSMSTMLGRGANCALLDVLSIAEALESPSSSTRYARNIALRKCVRTNVDRRVVERQRGAFVQNLVYFGDNKLKEFLRDHSMKKALDWV